MTKRPVQPSSHVMEEFFGITTVLSTVRVLPGRCMGEQHAIVDLARIPTAVDWLGNSQPARWMLGRGQEFAD